MSKFPKSERLSSKRSIQELFNRGVAFTEYPIKTVYLRKLKTDPGEPNQMLVSIPKRKHKKAVDRNKLKRRIREAYRLNKELLESQDSPYYLLIGYIYIGNNVSGYDIIEDKLKKTLLRLKELTGN